MPKPNDLPSLLLSEWKDTYQTLHLYIQIVGKIRLMLAPRKNHWWYITLYVSPKGFTTHAIPYGNESFEITFNVHTHQLELTTSQGASEAFALHDGLSVADFYQQLMILLEGQGIRVSIVDHPYDLFTDKPFGQITEYHSYQPEYVHRYWRIMLWVDQVFKEFSGRFYGKTCPVHIYWHHMDLTVTRFSGKKAPPMPAEARLSDKAAYSHEVISFGFWAGDDQMPSPAFYSYTAPAPDKLDKQPLEPAVAQWIDNNGSPMALLMYDDLLKQENPHEVLLAFMESAYQAGAQLAAWPIEELTVPPLEFL